MNKRQAITFDTIGLGRRIRHFGLPRDAMIRMTSRTLMIFCVLSSLSMTIVVAKAATDSDSNLASPATQQRQLLVSEWFAKYDQTRRDAEMTLDEKLSSRSALKKKLKAGEKLSKDHRALAEKMISKYGAAASAVKALPVLPETKDLQEGYTQYFIDMKRLFSVFLEEKEDSPSVRESHLSAKKDLEELDKNNKTLDAALRKQYCIPKHEHR